MPENLDTSRLQCFTVPDRPTEPVCIPIAFVYLYSPTAIALPPCVPHCAAASVTVCMAAGDTMLRAPCRLRSSAAGRRTANAEGAPGASGGRDPARGWGACSGGTAVCGARAERRHAADPPVAGRPRRQLRGASVRALH